ncbi:MAG: TonB family protein [bacterium]
MAWSDEHRLGETDADTLIRRGALEQADGKLEEAESHFREAESLLTSALDRSGSAEDAHGDELPIVLRELSRLYILRSAYDKADAPLSRLLAITEAQGDDRPEVATVLASLAAVRHALGNYASAEQLYRRALNIRERALTPNHITTAFTLESLAETCAARGRFAEAVSLCNRAVSIRETTLGANDASIRVARQRIADLQLQAQEESRVSTPPRSAPAVRVSAPVEPPPRQSGPIVGASRLPAVLVPLPADLAAVRAEIESTSMDLDADPFPHRSSLATSGTSRASTAIVVAAGVVVLAGMGYKQFTNKKPIQRGFVEAEPYNPAARSQPSAVANATISPQALASSNSFDTVAVAPSNRDVAERVLPAVAPQALPQTVPPKAAARELPRPQTTPVVAVPTRKRPDSVQTRAPTPVVEKAPEARARSEAANAPTSPVLIGTAPQPQYPDGLRDQQVEGDVVVQFVVEENGRPDVSSMTVVRSPHALLTNAVRAVLPQMQFEPARTAPPQSIPRPETVRFAFTFRAPRR